MYNQMNKIFLGTIFSLLFPLFAFAQITSVQGLIDEIADFIQYPLIPIAVSLGVLFFFYGIAKFILAGGDEKNIESGKLFMRWSVIALFIMISIVGIIEVLQAFFGGNFVWDLQINPNP